MDNKRYNSNPPLRRRRTRSESRIDSDEAVKMDTLGERVYADFRTKATETFGHFNESFGHLNESIERYATEAGIDAAIQQLQQKKLQVTDAFNTKRIEVSEALETKKKEVEEVLENIEIKKNEIYEYIYTNLEGIGYDAQPACFITDYVLAFQSFGCALWLAFVAQGFLYSQHWPYITYFLGLGTMSFIGGLLHHVAYNALVFDVNNIDLKLNMNGSSIFDEDENNCINDVNINRAEANRIAKEIVKTENENELKLTKANTDDTNNCYSSDMSLNIDCESRNENLNEQYDDDILSDINHDHKRNNNNNNNDDNNNNNNNNMFETLQMKLRRSASLSSLRSVSPFDFELKDVINTSFEMMDEFVQPKIETMRMFGMELKQAAADKLIETSWRIVLAASSITNFSVISLYCNLYFNASVGMYIIYISAFLYIILGVIAVINMNTFYMMLGFSPCLIGLYFSLSSMSVDYYTQTLAEVSIILLKLSSGIVQAVSYKPSKIYFNHNALAHVIMSGAASMMMVRCIIDLQ